MHTRTTLWLAASLLLGGCATSKSIPASRDPVLDAYVAQVRADLSDGKVAVINEVMHLTPAEAAAFWPVYSEYEDDLFALGDRRLELIKTFVAAQSKGALDDASAGALATDWLKLQRDSADLMQAYYTRLAKEVSPRHAAQFLQIEHRTNTVIDLVIASQMPLVMEPRSGGSADGP